MLLNCLESSWDKCSEVSVLCPQGGDKKEEGDLETGTQRAGERLDRHAVPAVLLMPPAAARTAGSQP
jgi:hypothetical protein